MAPGSSSSGGGAAYVCAESTGGADGAAVTGGAITRTRVAGRTDAHDNAAAANTIAVATQSVRRASCARAIERWCGARMTEGKDTTRWKADAAFRAEGGSLYVVATPIGNLRDVTLRALDILASAEIIAAEDTRVTSTLLARYAIATRPRALHRHNEAREVEALVAALGAGRSVALVTDAGTPGISDPGARLARAASAAGHRVVPIPGPSAVAAAVSAAGLVAERFAFIGFLPSQAKARREWLATASAWPLALVFYEAPHRVAATLAALAEAFDPRRTLVVARELTKTFETIASMPLAGAVEWLGGDSNRARGELVLIVDAPLDDAASAQFAPQAERLLVALLEELPPARAARVVAGLAKLPRDAVYARALELQARSAADRER
jgi:16S rRNA (cytidine1402-2'-O)-methyltransferase